MKKLLAIALLFVGPVFAQTVIDYTPTIKGAIVGTLDCTFYSQSISPGSVQIYCFLTDTGKTVINMVGDTTQGNVVGFFARPNIGEVTWTLSLNTILSAAPNSIQYEICASALPAQTPTQVLTGIF